jgi:hypothetical protein
MVVGLNGSQAMDMQVWYITALEYVYQICPGPRLVI